MKHEQMSTLLAWRGTEYIVAGAGFASHGDPMRLTLVSEHRGWHAHAGDGARASGGALEGARVRAVVHVKSRV